MNLMNIETDAEKVTYTEKEVRDALLVVKQYALILQKSNDCYAVTEGNAMESAAQMFIDCLTRTHRKERVQDENS